MAEMIELDIVGVPMSKGNKTGFVRGGKVVMVEGRRPKARKAVESWKEALTTAARDWVAEHPGFVPLDGPLAVETTVWLPRPASVPARRRPWPTVPPDVEKLARAAFDPLTKIIWTDDARIVQSLTTKRYADGRTPGARITVTEVTW